MNAYIQWLFGKRAKFCGFLASLGAFRTFVRFALVWFSLLLGVWIGLRFVHAVLSGLFTYPFSV